MQLKEIHGGEIIYYKGNLATILGYSPRGEKCVIIEPLTDEGKNKCPNCSHPVPTRIHVNENCRNWEEDVKPVETLTPSHDKDK